MTPRTHQFAAVAFEENLSLRELAAAYPDARLGLREMRVPVGDDEEIFIYRCGAVVFRAVPPDGRGAGLARLGRARPGLTRQVVRESFTVREEPGRRVDIVDGNLVVDQFGDGRAAVVALIVAQSAALEYYERIVERLFARTIGLVEPLERYGSVSTRVRGLHRVIGEALATRHQVLTLLAPLHKPPPTL